MKGREDIGRFPIIWSVWTKDLVDAKFWVIDGVNNALAFNDEARVVGVNIVWTTLSCFPRDWQWCIENPVAGVYLTKQRAI